MDGTGRQGLIREYQRLRSNYLRFISRHRDQLRGYTPVGVPSGLRERSSQRISGSIRRLQQEYSKIRTGLEREKRRDKDRLESEALDKLQEMLNIAMYLPEVGVSEYYPDGRYLNKNGKLFPAVRKIVTERGHNVDRGIKKESKGSIIVGDYEIPKKRIVVENLEANYESVHEDLETYIYGYTMWGEDKQSEDLLTEVLKLLADHKILRLDENEKMMIDDLSSSATTWEGEMYD